MGINYLKQPEIVKTAISRAASDGSNLAEVYFKTGLFLGSIFGLIENDGDADLVLNLKQSSDNGDTDPYATINFRVAGASVATITVKPKGKVAFTIELATEPYLKFHATNDNSFGRLVVGVFGEPLLTGSSLTLPV